MDENKPPEETTPAPTPAPEPAPEPAPAAQAQTSAPSSASGAGPVPFAGPPDASVPQDMKTQALLCWILGVFVSFIGPLIFFFIAKDKPFVYHHAAQALTFDIVMFVLFIIAGVLSCVGIGLILFPILWLAMLAVGIMGAIAANAGSRFEPPVSGNLAKSWFKA